MHADASAVYVRGERGSWSLEVDGKPFYIEGVGCGLAHGRKGEDYLRLAQKLGANAVRTWGMDQGTKGYLDLAAKYGLKVCAGVWLNSVDNGGKFSYRYDQGYMVSKKKEVLDYVRKFKDHPAILMWGIGNEAIFFTKGEEEKIALCDFLEELIQDIHAIDPHHPVVYASAGIADLKYLAQYVPSLDIIGINEYGSIRIAHGNWDYLGMDRPYIFTEYGPALNINRPKDANGVSIEPSDTDKAKRYKEFAEEICSFKGYNLGGFAFHLGETTQESMTWWNLNQGRFKRPSFWAIYEYYTGKRSPTDPMRIKKLSLSKTKDIKPNETIRVNVEFEPADRKGLIIEYALSTSLENVLKYYVNDFVPVEIYSKKSMALIKVPKEKGLYRIYCFIKDREGNISSANKSICVE